MKEHEKHRLIPRVLALLLAFLATACVREEFPQVDSSEARWVTYENDEVGYSLEVPQAYRLQEWDQDTVALFRYEGAALVVVSYTSGEDGRRQGIWFDHEPYGPATLGGREGLEYRYVHWDGPCGVPTRSFVVEHGDRWLGLEFRTAGDLDEVYTRTLESFRFK